MQPLLARSPDRRARTAQPLLDACCTAVFGIEVLFIAVALGSAGLLPLFVALLFVTDAVISRCVWRRAAARSCSLLAALDASTAAPHARACVHRRLPLTAPHNIISVKLTAGIVGAWLSSAVYRAGACAAARGLQGVSARAPPPPPPTLRALLSGLVDVSPLSGPIQMKKWTEQSWQLFSHVVFAALEWRILSSEPWYRDPATCWSPHPYEQAGAHRPDLTMLYLMQLAVWVYTCVIHRFFDERRKDYFVLYIHHIVTIMLVGAWRAARIIATLAKPRARATSRAAAPLPPSRPPIFLPLARGSQRAPFRRGTCASA